MTTASTFATRPRVAPRFLGRGLWISALVAASVASTFAFSCAAPLAAFAAIAALTLGRREALVAVGGAWLANQAVGFAFLHYPMEASTLGWGAALGAISLLSCEVAGQVERSFGRIESAGRAFAMAICAFGAAFVVYEGLILAMQFALGRGFDYGLLAIVARIFIINLAAFAGLWTLYALRAVASLRRKPAHGLVLRHV
jgi:hypothetical protein